MKNVIFTLLLSAAISSCGGTKQQPEAKRSANMNQAQATGYVIEEVAGGLEVPWSIVFTSPTRMLVTERAGRVRVIENGTLQPQPLHTFSEVVSTAEEGLMGLALDPDYAQNHYLYLSLAYSDGGPTRDKVVRMTDAGDRLTDQQVLIDDIPAARFHAGCRLKFGPDGKLYITTGDATNRELAQDVNLLNGKILRINRDGSIPNDNPFPNNPMWSYGHRNPQGIDWHPNGELYESEHGPSGGDGPGGGDEINRIVKGGNYGWPLVSHEKTKEGTVAPLIVFTPAEAPASLLVYSGRKLPLWKYNLFVGCLRGHGLLRLEVDPQDPDRIVADEKLFESYGRVRDVTEGPDGFIYFSTSNRDGRGDPQANDDRVMRIRAQ